ncbi:MAG: hypothetical protein IJ041_02345 [Clostridia bacterium]|nr:hypothetical protein [Clostridia bacterium]
MNEFLAPINYDRARDVLRRLDAYARYTPEGARQVRAILEECYPLIFSRMELQTFANDALLLELPGASVTDPLVFTARLDVPAGQHGEQGWQADNMPLHVPLSRAHVVSLLEALEELLRDGYCPGGDLILALSMDGLSGGEGARSMAEHLKSRGITPCYVLDFGGYVTMDAFRNFLPKGAPLALIGIDEKALQEVRIKAADRLSMAALFRLAARVKQHPLHTSLCSASEKMLKKLSRQASGLYALLLRSPRLTFPLLRLKWRNRSVMQQFFVSRQTVCTLEASGSRDEPAAEATLLIRRLMVPGSGKSLKKTEHYCRRNGLTLQLENDYAHGQESSTTGEALDALETAIEIQFERTVIAPCLCPQVTDGRFYDLHGGRVYRFSPFMVTGDEALEGRCTVTDGALQTAVQFFRSMLSV